MCLLWCCVNSTVKWLYIYIYLLFFGFPSHLGNHRAYSSSLCHTIDSRLIFIVYIASILYIGKFNFPIPPTLLSTLISIPLFSTLFWKKESLDLCPVNSSWLVSTNTQVHRQSPMNGPQILLLVPSLGAGSWAHGKTHLLCWLPLKACHPLLPEFLCLRNQYFMFFVFYSFGSGTKGESEI